MHSQVKISLSWSTENVWRTESSADPSCKGKNGGLSEQVVTGQKQATAG